MNPLFAVKFLDCLPDTTQWLLSFREKQFRIVLDQPKQSASEVGVHQDALLLVAIRMHSKPTGTRKFGGEALGQFVERLGHALEHK